MTTTLSLRRRCFLVPLLTPHSAPPPSCPHRDCLVVPLLTPHSPPLLMHRDSYKLTEEVKLSISRIAALCLLSMYIQLLAFQMWTHKHLFEPEGNEDEEDEEVGEGWGDRVGIGGTLSRCPVAGAEGPAGLTHVSDGKGRVIEAQGIGTGRLCRWLLRPGRLTERTQYSARQAPTPEPDSCPAA